MPAAHKPSILFATPPYVGIHHAFIQNLEHCGFEVCPLILDELPPFKYPSLAARLATKCRQLLGQKDAKERLREQQHSQAYLAQLPDRRFDYALLVRCDMYPLDVIREIKHRTDGTTAYYQWDGMERFPSVWKLADSGLIDRFFVFQAEDIGRRPHFLPLTNFYWDFPLHTAAAAPEYDFYFIGGHNPCRSGMVADFARYAAAAGWQLDFTVYLHNPAPDADYPTPVTLTRRPLSLTENLQRLQNSKVLVDFVIDAHQGLSLRTFEALGYRKKLITTNAEAAKYDFYHPDNIYIFDGSNFDGIDAFLAKPYAQIDPEIRQKYSFGNWIRYVLDLPPYQAIRLPEKKFLRN